jgi:hypothetical protein
MNVTNITSYEDYEHSKVFLMYWFHISLGIFTMIMTTVSIMCVYSLYKNYTIYVYNKYYDEYDYNIFE